MSKQVLDNSNINVHLGKTSQYKNTYDKSLLVKEPRQNNRTYLGIQDESLPFVGFDTWNAYECSFLLSNGCPVTGVAKICYPADSKYIVESKSIKLYFNSFNMEKLGGNVRDGILNFKNTASADLSDLLGTNVRVSFLPGFLVDKTEVSAHDFYNKDLFVTLENDIKEEDLMRIKFDTYTETPDLLLQDMGILADKYSQQEQFFHSGLLKSNCRVTSQPDWGDVYIYMKADTLVSQESLLKYIVSFRDECHFHEEICECIYKRLHDIFKPTELFVMCLYARRGGIDINPVRASSQDLMFKFSKNLYDIYGPHVKTSKQ
jgi:7-cyano-7-deazaguanine reductase